MINQKLWKKAMGQVLKDKILERLQANTQRILPESLGDANPPKELMMRVVILESLLVIAMMRICQALAIRQRSQRIFLLGGMIATKSQGGLLCFHHLELQLLQSASQMLAKRRVLLRRKLQQARKRKRKRKKRKTLILRYDGRRN